MKFQKKKNRYLCEYKLFYLKLNYYKIKIYIILDEIIRIQCHINRNGESIILFKNPGTSTCELSSFTETMCSCPSSIKMLYDFVSKKYH